MSTGLSATICVLAVTSISGCSRELSRDEAQRIIEGHSLIRPTDKVSVDAISSTSPTEAVVRATIAGATTNLKLRRFDSGWTWEFVETKAAGWIAPDVAIGQIREEHRTVAAAAWADQNRTAYAATAKTMDLIVLLKVPNPTAQENIERWLMLNQSFLRMAKENSDQERLAVLTKDNPEDAWGSGIETRLDSHKAIMVSAGPDKIKGTEDDLLGLVTFRRDVEDGRMVWAKDLVWTLPEGLGNAVEPVLDKRTDRVEYTKVVKP